MARSPLKVDSGPVSATDPLRYVPKDRWRDLMLARRHFAEVNVSYDCRCLVQFCDDANAMHKELGFGSTEAMIRDGYGLEPEEVNLAIEWLKLNPPDDPIPLEAAIELGRQGRPRKGEEKGGNATFSYTKNAKPHIEARLRRDHPALYEDVKEGRLSANAAAIQAGFRKPRKPLDQIRKLLPKLTPAEKQALRKMLDD